MAKTLNYLLEIDVKPGDVVFVRIDCNVPLKDDGAIADSFRLDSVIPTLEFLRDKKAKIVLAGAIGRPKGKRDEALSTRCIAEYFNQRVFTRCIHTTSAYGEEVESALANIGESECVVLENLRFWIEEESNDADFAKMLAQSADFYVNDAFGQCHRKQASIVAITDFLPSFAGLCLQKEVDSLEGVLSGGEKPFVAIVGGAKVSDKLGVIEALLDRADKIIVGGAMAYTFLKAKGQEIGKSLCEDEYLERAKVWLETGKIILPKDSIIADGIDSNESSVAIEIQPTCAGFDIGPESIEEFVKIIASANTILWNGPMGVFEKPQFANGTKAVAEAVSKSQAFSVVGGGDSVAAIRELNLEDSIDHVSTGGGATLEYIENGTLVGIEPLVK